MVMAVALTPTIEAWDKRWATAEGLADWRDPAGRSRSAPLPY
jgi:hypothetical protein